MSDILSEMNCPLEVVRNGKWGAACVVFFRYYGGVIWQWEFIEDNLIAKEVFTRLPKVG